MEIVLRAAAVFFVLWALTRALGKKELAQMSSFELVLLVVIGDLVQQGVTQEDMSVTGAVLAVGTISLLVLGFSYAGFRWRGARRLIEGVPAVVVREGRVMTEVLDIERMTLDELHAEAREQGIGSLDEVALGVLEPDGRLSLVRADRIHQPTTEGSTR